MAATSFSLYDIYLSSRTATSSTPWARIKAATGVTEMINFDKPMLIREYKLASHDLRLIDPSFDYPPKIVIRENAFVFNMEGMRCIITADELLLWMPFEEDVTQFVVELQQRLAAPGLPFEFTALQLALKTVCSSFKKKTNQLVYDERRARDLASKIHAADFEEEVHQWKSEIVSLIKIVQKAKDEVEQLLDDEVKMSQMFLTEKKRRFGSRASSLLFSPLPSVSILQLAMLLEPILLRINISLQMLTEGNEEIDWAEIQANVLRDNIRNMLLQFELIMSTMSFVVIIFATIMAVFGVSFDIPLFKEAKAFQWVILVAGIFSLIILCCLLFYLKYKRLMPEKLT